MDVAKVPNPLPAARPEATVEHATSGEIALIDVKGLVDERFRGFGALGATKSVVINVAGITRMTSFGVRQWLKSMDALPKAISELLLVGCPTFFVDQLNMVLNFGGASKVLTVSAPYTCPSCGMESSETFDVLKERDNLASGGLPEKECARCGGKLEFDETPESYFSFVAKYGASNVDPATAQFLASRGLYTAVETAAEKPPRIIKLVHGAVTYFRIIGRIGSMFRARPFLVGAEGEVVIDLADVETIEPAGLKEWQRLLRSLSSQVPSVSLVDLKEAFLAVMDESLTIAPNLVVATLLVPYVCLACGRRSLESKSLRGRLWPPNFEDAACSTCNATTRHEISGGALLRLKNANTMTPPATEQVIAQRLEILGRALTDSAAPQQAESAIAATTGDDTILGKYKIVQRLPSAGLAEVFLAKQVGIGGFEKPVVLKRIRRKLLEAHQQAIDLLLSEVNRAARLTHANIVQVLDVGEVDGALYLATEYVHGRNLRDILEQLHATRTVMPLAEACFIAREVAQAVDHAYWATDLNGQPLSVIHGDVSPHNIIISSDGTVKVADFGVAISASEHVDVQYMAPELATNEAITHRSDLFSIGVLLYYMCSGVMPFTGTTSKDIAKKMKAGKYRPLHEVANVPAMLSPVVSRLLSANAEERPARGQDVASDLTDIARRSGAVTSATNIAKFVAQLFPNLGEQDTALVLQGRESQLPVPYSPDVIPSQARSSRLSLDASVALRPRDGTSGEATAEPRVRWPFIATLAIILAALVAYLVHRL